VTLVLIGSKAFSYYTDLQRVPGDVDLVGTMDEVQSFIRTLGDVRRCHPFNDGKKYVAMTPASVYEFELAWSGSSAAGLVELVRQDPASGKIDLDGHEVLVPDLHVLYALKLSHRYLKDSPHFLKTMRDIQLMRCLGARLLDEHLPWYRLREEETYWYKHPKLNVMKSDFFKGDGVRYVYDHDDIHRAVAHIRWDEEFPTPAYRFYMKDGAQVQCDREKFFALPEETRLLGVLEEAYVLALERSQIPHRGKVTPEWSFQTALMKVCTSITSGWFREFAWENYDRVVRMYSPDYVTRFWEAVERGEVRPHNDSEEKETAR
jgi:hypothetical protein